MFAIVAQKLQQHQVSCFRSLKRATKIYRSVREIFSRLFFLSYLPIEPFNPFQVKAERGGERRRAVGGGHLGDLIHSSTNRVGVEVWPASQKSMYKRSTTLVKTKR